MAKHPPEENPLTAIVDEFTEKDAGNWFVLDLYMGQYRLVFGGTGSVLGGNDNT